MCAATAVLGAVYDGCRRRASACDHRLEARIIAEDSEVRIDLCVVQEPGSRRLEKRTEQIQRRIYLVQINDKCTGKVVAHSQIIGINQQRAVHPLLGAFNFAKGSECIGAVADDRSIVRILRQYLF
jgi:hypothetical protein